MLKWLNNWNTNKLQARPGQSLIDHITNIINNIPPFFFDPLVFKINSNTEEPLILSLKKILEDSFLLTIICHDIGKLNPFFQYHISCLEKRCKSIPNLPDHWKKYSYHVEFGVFLLKRTLDNYYISILNYSYLNKDFITKNIIEYCCIFTIFTFILCTCVGNHHFKIFEEGYYSKIEDESVQIVMEQYFALDQSWDSYFSFTPYKNLRAFIDSLFQHNNRIDIRLSSVIKESLEDWNIESLEEIRMWMETIYDFLLIKNDREISSIDLHFPINSTKYESLCRIGLKNFKRKEINIFIYYLQRYLNSLLTDLDVWDARYHSKNPKDFHFINKPYYIDSSIIEKYREKKFEITDSPAKIYFSLKKIIQQNNLIIAQSQLVDLYRAKLYYLINRINFNKINCEKIYTLTAPTGTGKTLSLLYFAFKLRKLDAKSTGIYNKIIYVLPFISIGEQVGDILTDILSLPKEKQSSKLIVHNYLSSRIWTFLENEKQFKKDDFTHADAYYFINIWNSDIIVTTLIKLFETCFNSQKVVAKRFHRIANSIIILDEVQAIPPKYWDLCRHLFEILTNQLHCKIILATATQPAILENAFELAPKLLEFEDINNFKNLEMNGNKQFSLLELNRYIIKYHPDDLSEEEFIDEIHQIIQNTQYNIATNHILITVNKKGFARLVFNELEKRISSECELFLLSGYVLPVDRKTNLVDIKTKLEDKNYDGRIILVTTQLIEAGVDISFPIVIRDFAPLDSLIQIFGRCNRHGENTFGGLAYVYNIRGKNGLHANIVYQDSITLPFTRDILSDAEYKRENYYELNESILRTKFKEYFKNFRKLGKRTNRGINEINRIDFKQLSDTVQLIEGYEDTIPLFICKDDKSKKLGFEIIQHIKKQDVKQRIPKSLSFDFFLYSINVSYKKVGHLPGIKIFTLKDESIPYLLMYKEPENKQESLYSYKKGLNIIS